MNLMFMPSERIWREMQSEPAGFWPVPINAGDEFAFLAKLPTNVIKAAYRTAPVGLAVATASSPIGNVLATVLHVADDPAAPLGVSGVHRHPEEQMALIEILRAGRTLFVFVDELSRPVARADCALEPVAAAVALARMEAVSGWYAGAWSPALAQVLDEVDALADPTRQAPPNPNSTLTDLRLILTGFETCRITSVGRHQAIDFRLEDGDEGHGLEQASWQLLEGLFAGDIFHSPQVVEPGGARELTDILGVCPAGCLLVETKVAAVLSTGMDRSTSRRAGNVRKQIDKGLAQITGALRNLSALRPLLTQSGNPITLKAGGRRVGIVMVSELLPGVDWEAVARHLAEVSAATAARVLVLDLRELRTLVGVSRTPEALLTHCERRHRLTLSRSSQRF
jgi:hypothetical protein